MVDLAEIQAAYYMVAATGVLVAAIYYVFNMRATLQIRREANRTQRQQLETRQAQMFMGIYTQITTKEFTSAWQKVMNSQWRNYDEWQELWKDPEFQNAAQIVGTYYEGVGVLVKEGLLDIRWVALLMCGGTRMYWEKMKPAIEEGRRAMGFPRWMSETEYLYDELMRYLEKHPELKT